MADTIPPSDPLELIESHLHNTSELLRHTKKLDAESARALAELVQEMSHALENEDLSQEELAHLAQTSGHLEEALRLHEDHGLLGNARAGLERAVSSAETEAPIAVGLARRILDALANIGI